MKFKIFLFLLALRVSAASDYAEDRKQWHKFMTKFNRNYDNSKKDHESFVTFRNNLKFINDHNKNPNSTFKMAINSVADNAESDECHESESKQRFKLVLFKQN
jgi:uncharacterized protein YukE